VQEWPLRPISAACLKNNARNIEYMPVLIFFAVLDLERNGLFLNRHYPKLNDGPMQQAGRRPVISAAGRENYTGTRQFTVK
jgi:hypothetical protein